MDASTPQSLIQSREYERPYHWIASRDSLSWVWRYGLEYLVYIERVRRVCVGLGGLVLDVGCGDGRFLKDVRGIGCDLDRRAVQWARAALPSRDFYGISSVFVGRGFDIVTAIEVLEHIPDNDVDDFLRDLARHGNKWVVLTVPTTLSPVSPKHYRHYDESSFRLALDSVGRFRNIHITGIYRQHRSFAFFQKLLRNRLWTLEIPWLNRWAHDWAMKNLMHGRTNECYHLLAVAEVIQ